MLEKVIAYFEQTYIDTKRGIEREYKWATPFELVNRGISDCLAVAMFSQSIGCTYNEVNPYFEEYKDKFEKLLDIED